MSAPPTRPPAPLTTASARASSPSPRVLLTVEAAAERLSISRTRLYELIRTGDIGSVRVGRLRRVPADFLADFVQRLKAEQLSHDDMVEKGS